MPDCEQWDRGVSQFPIRLPGERIVAFDWHQVSDTFRFNSRSCERLSDQYILPDGVLGAFREVANAKREGDLVIVLSHIHQSQYNRDQLYSGQCISISCRLIWS